MISLTGDMTVVGKDKSLRELRAVGGTATTSTRHFLASTNKGETLTLRWLKLIGGKVSNDHGGSIFM